MDTRFPSIPFERVTEKDRRGLRWRTRETIDESAQAHKGYSANEVHGVGALLRRQRHSAASLHTNDIHARSCIDNTLPYRVPSFNAVLSRRRRNVIPIEVPRMQRPATPLPLINFNKVSTDTGYWDLRRVASTKTMS